MIKDCICSNSNNIDSMCKKCLQKKKDILANEINQKYKEYDYIQYLLDNK